MNITVYTRIVQSILIQKMICKSIVKLKGCKRKIRYLKNENENDVFIYLLYISVYY